MNVVCSNMGADVLLVFVALRADTLPAKLAPMTTKDGGTFFCIPFPSKNHTPVKGKVQFAPSLAT